MRLDPHDLPCGCRSCGCMCADHSPSGVDDLCARHALPVLARWALGEALALVAIGLLIASASVWCVILAVPAPS